jgi:hypothetical protein
MTGALGIMPVSFLRCISCVNFVAGKSDMHLQGVEFVIWSATSQLTVVLTAMTNKFQTLLLSTGTL